MQTFLRRRETERNGRLEADGENARRRHCTCVLDLDVLIAIELFFDRREPALKELLSLGVRGSDVGNAHPSCQTAECDADDQTDVDSVSVPMVDELLPEQREKRGPGPAHAYYVFFEPKPGNIDIEDALLERSIEAPQVYRGSFTAPLTKESTPAPVSFRLPTAAPPPPGMMAAIVFKLNITITPPHGSGRPPLKRQRTYGGPLIRSEVSIPPHCLRLRGPIASGSFYLGVSDCTKAIMAAPQKR